MCLRCIKFYAKNQEIVKLADICNLHGNSEVFTWELKKLIRYCPSVLQDDTLNVIDFDKLAGLSPGFYLPSNKYNNTADVIGILNVKNTNKTKVKRLILFIQLKDWSKRYSFTKHIIDEWRWSQQFVTESDVYLKRDDKEKSVNQFSAYWKEHKDHMPVFLIFSANKIESISTGGEFSNVEFNETTQYKEKHLRENEGTMNLEHAKSWFPTFGYNLQAVHNLSHRK